MEPGGRLPARSVGPPRPGDARTLSAAVYVQNGWTKDGRLTKEGSLAIFRKTWQNAPAAAWRGLWQLRQDALIEWRWLTESGQLTQLGVAKINDGSWNNPPGAVAEQRSTASTTPAPRSWRCSRSTTSRRTAASG